MALRLDNKAAILGKAFKGHNVRPETEEGGEGGDAGEPVPAREYRLTGIPLTKNQFEELVGEGSWNSFFDKRANQPAKFAFETFKTLWLDPIFKNCSAKFCLGNTNTKEIEISEGVRIRNLSIKFDGEQATERACAKLSCTVTGIFPRNVVTLDMESFLGKEIRVSLRFGQIEEQTEADKSKQTDLVEQAREDGDEKKPDENPASAIGAHLEEHGTRAH